MHQSEEKVKKIESIAMIENKYFYKTELRFYHSKIEEASYLFLK